jgi:glycine cleavage system H protein
MSDLPENLHYAQTHEWAMLEDNQLVRVGITDFAQAELGDLVFIELPTVGRQLKAGEQCAVVESVKTASDLFAPVAGVIVAINDKVCDEPQLVNDAPYQNWLFCIKADDIAELEQLMTAAAYQDIINA